jgi:hypothetical protein
MALLSDNEVRLRISAKAEGDKEVQRLEATVESLEKELESLGKTTKTTNAEQLKASKQLADARTKQDEIKRALNETNEEYKRQMALVKQGGKDQQKYADEAAATRRRMDQLRASFSETGKEVFRLNDGYKRAAAQSRFLSAEQRRVSQELKDAAGAVQRARQKLADLSAGAKETGGVFDGLRGKIAAALAALGGFAAAKRVYNDVTDAAETLDVQMRKIEATIQATGGAAGLSATEISAMAERLDEATLGSAEGFRNAAAKLLTFKSIGKDAFEATLKLAQDLAANGFGTLESNIVQLGKALENPKQGISALAEAGVTFSDQQKTLINYLVETGKQAQAQGVVLQAVAGQVEGVASAVGQGMSGAADLASKRFTDLKETLGGGLLPVLADFYNGLAELFKRLTDSGAVERFGKVLGDVFRGAGEAFLRFLGQVDIDALSARMSTWADQSGEAVTRWIGHIESAGNVAKLVFSAISTGASTILAGIYKLGEAFAGVASNIQSGVALILDGFAKLSFGDLSAKFTEWANDVRTSAQATWAVSEAYADEAAKAFDSAASSAESFQTAWAGLTQTATDTAAAVAEVGKSAGLTAEQVAALGNDTEFVNGELRKIESSSTTAANGLGTLTDATKKAADEQMRLTEKTLAVEAAFEKLGITSSASLKKQADEARAAYELIKKSGMATARDLQLAFEAYAQRAISANDGIASDSLRVEAALAGVKLKTEEVADATERAAAGYHEMADEASSAAGAVEDLADAQNAVRTASAGEVRARGSAEFNARDVARDQGLPSEVIDDLVAHYDEMVKREFAGKRYSNKVIGEYEYRKIYEQAVRDFQPHIDRYSRESIAAAQSQASAAQAADQSAQRNSESVQRPVVQVSSFRVDLSINRGASTSVNVASRDDADALSEFFRRIEADMSRAS